MLELSTILKILDTRFDELNNKLWENKVSPEIRSMCSKTKTAISKDLLNENTVSEITKKYDELKNKTKCKILRFILDTFTLINSIIGLFFILIFIQHINTPLKDIDATNTVFLTIGLFMFINIVNDLIKPKRD